MDTYTEYSNLGIFGRLKNALGGIIFGVIFTIVAVIALFLNEGRAVKRYKALQEGESVVVSVAADSIDPENEGKLVHISGTTDVKSGPLNDPVFGVTEPGIKLKRTAEMYQWKETSKKEGSGSNERTVYSYQRTWSGDVISSSGFKKSGHENPKSMPYRSETFTAQEVDLGAFRLAPFLVSKINQYEDISVDSLDDAETSVTEKGKLSSGQVYFGNSEGSPEIGDVRVQFSVVSTGPTSLVAQQTGNTFEIYQAKYGTIALLDESAKTASELFADAHTRNKLMTWAIRGGGFLFMAMGIGLLFKPLTVLSDMIPVIGNIARAGAGFISTVVAGIISFVTIAIAWIFYRPILGISLLVVAVALLVWIIARVGKKKAEAAQVEGSSAGSMGTPPPMN